MMADPERKPLESTVPLSAEILPPVREPVEVRPLLVTEAPSQAAADVFPAWSGWDVAAVLCFTLAAVFLFSTVALGVAHLLTSKQHVAWTDLASNPLVVIGSQVLAYPIVMLFMMTLVRNKTRERFWPAIRWNWPGPAMLRFLIAGAAFAFTVEFASRWLPIPKSLPVDRFFTDTHGAYLMAAFGITLAPLLEELFFRGMLYPVLRQSVGVGLGIMLTSIAFAFIHGAQLGYAWAPLLSIFVVGIMFTVVREKTNSVAASFLMHCGYNLALFATLWVGSDHFRHLELALK
ncbi:MAG TPA: CPBP family intramembrane glutamic endopeptidase [Terriglobales bacterium]